MNKYGEIDYIAASDNAWLREIREQITAETPPHRSFVTWAEAERGVAQFRVDCKTCGQIATGSDKAALQSRAAKHEAGGVA